MDVVIGWSALVISSWLAFHADRWRRRTFGMPPLFSDLRDALNELARTQNDVEPGVRPGPDADQRPGSFGRSTPVG